MDARDPNRDEIANFRLGAERKQPSRKRGNTFSVTFALTPVEDRLADLLAQKTGSRSRSVEARMGLRERAQRILGEEEYAEAMKEMAAAGNNE